MQKITENLLHGRLKVLRKLITETENTPRASHYAARYLEILDLLGVLYGDTESIRVYLETSRMEKLPK